MKHCVALLFVAASGLLAQTTTTYTLPPAVCVKISNCIIYGPSETFSLWTTPTWSIFDLNALQNGVIATVDSYNCTSQAYGIDNTPGVIASASCSGTDSNGVPFSMTYSVRGYSYYSRGGGGRGGGGAGTRWMITGGTVSITQ